MSRVIIITPTEEMTQETLALLPESQLDARVFTESSHSVLARVREEQRNGALVALARGNHANLIQQNLDIPLVEIRFSGQSIAQLIDRARRISDKAHPVIAFVGFANMFSDIAVFDDILGVRTLLYLVEDSEQIPACVAKAAQEGADVLVGGEIALDEAAKIRLDSIFLRSTRDDLLDAVRAAKRLLYAIELEKKNTVEVTTLLDYSFDGIIKVDAGGRIAMANYMAERIFRTSAAGLLGRDLAGLFDEQDAQTVRQRLAGGENQQSFMLNKGKVSLIANLVSLDVSGASQGAIFSFQEFGAIEAMEEIIRQDRYSRVQKALRRFSDMASRSPAYLATLEEARGYAQFDVPVLIRGEAGSGKRTMSECLHNASLRRNNPFVAMDCAGMPEQMQEELLSGSEQHSLFKAAHTGTLFIDNIDRLTPMAQYQLLSALRDGVIWQPDRVKALPVNLRVIAACSCNLYPLSVEGAFNRSLYTLLSQFTLSLPALRDRPEDIDMLIDQYIERYCTKYRKRLVLSPQARQVISQFPWPGNLMQLNLYAEKLTLLAAEQLVTAEFVQRTLPDSYLPDTPAPGVPADKPIIVYSQPEADRILSLLAKHGGSRLDTAQEMGISKTTLWRKMKEYGIRGSFKKEAPEDARGTGDEPG